MIGKKVQIKSATEDTTVWTSANYVANAVSGEAQKQHAGKVGIIEDEIIGKHPIEMNNINELNLRRFSIRLLDGLLITLYENQFDVLENV